MDAKSDIFVKMLKLMAAYISGFTEYFTVKHYVYHKFPLCMCIVHTYICIALKCTHLNRIGQGLEVLTSNTERLSDKRKEGELIACTVYMLLGSLTMVAESNVC